MDKEIDLRLYKEELKKVMIKVVNWDYAKIEANKIIPLLIR